MTWFFISKQQIGNYKVLCFNKISYVKIYFSAILKLDKHETYFQYGNQVYKFRSKQEAGVSSFYIFTLPFFTFSKESFIWNERNSLNLCHTNNHEKKWWNLHKIFIQTLTA